MCYGALLMAMIFSMGEQIPLHHYGKRRSRRKDVQTPPMRVSQCVSVSEHLNAAFLQFLLDVVEDGLPSDATEQLPDLFINLLLAFNLHLNGANNTKPFHYSECVSSY